MLALASCSRDPRTTKDTVVISAAASTREIVEALAEQFKNQSHVEVKVNTGPSSGLATQILEGAPADLFLSASQQWADEIQKGGQTIDSAKLLTNKLVLVVPKGNPAGVYDPKDLLSPKVKKIALAGEKVPGGMYADQSLTKLDLLKPLTDAGKIVRGQDVRSALAYVERGEAEAGIVYSTDLAAATNVESVYQFDPSSHDQIVYVLVLLKHAEKNPAAKQFYDFFQSDEANKVYEQFGFTSLTSK